MRDLDLVLSYLTGNLLTGRDIYTALGMPKATYFAQRDRGRLHQPENLLKLARAFGVNPVDLLVEYGHLSERDIDTYRAGAVTTPSLTVRSVPRPSAEHDPTGTIRRVITNWGFEHYMKFSQPPGCLCWLSMDCYGPTDHILPDTAWLTDAQIDARNDTEVVYVPMDDNTWARIHGLNPNPDIKSKDEIC